MTEIPSIEMICDYKDIQTIKIPYGDEEYEDQWIYKKYHVIFKIICPDGVFLVTILKG